MVICLQRGADLHTAQLMPLPLTVSCFSKIQLGFTFLVRLTWVVPDKGPLNGGVLFGRLGGFDYLGLCFVLRYICFVLGFTSVLQHGLDVSAVLYLMF